MDMVVGWGNLNGLESSSGVGNFKFSTNSTAEKMADLGMTQHRL